MSKSVLADVEAATAIAKDELLARFFQSPNDFFTESDLTAYFAHRLHCTLAAKALPHLVHLQYPTPFRCSMHSRVFEAKAEDELASGNRKYRRGFFDLVVLHPGFATEFANDFTVSKGQTWSVLQDALAQRDATSSPAAVSVFELMYLRDPVWGDQSRERGAKTMEKIAVEAKLDFDKARHAQKAMNNGFCFAMNASVLLFDNGLNASAALALKDLLDPEIEFYSAALGLPASVDADVCTWNDMDASRRVKAAVLKELSIPDSPGVYAWFSNGARMYVGTAASLRNRIFRNHLGTGKSLSGSSLRRNVAEQLGYASSAALKNGSVTLDAQQLAAVRTWLGSCDVAWLTCTSPGHALALESRLKAEFMPPLTKR